jgi:hypothetical protein
LSISAREVAGFLHVELELPRLVAADKGGAAAAWEEAPRGAHILLVDTYIMGRAEMPITYLLFSLRLMGTPYPKADLAEFLVQ